MKTKHAITMEFGKGRIKAPLTIPAGTRVIKCPPDGDGISRGYFVDDLSFLDSRTITYHDAYYYGIRVSAQDVDGAE